MKAVNPYLTLPGTSEEAFTFYRSVLGGAFTTLQRFADTPMAATMPAADRGKIVHVSLPLPNGSVLMASDACESLGKTLRIGTNVSISIETDSEAETTSLFTRLSAGGTAGMAPQKTFWGAFFATCTDRFGVQWMLNHTYPKT